MPANELQATLYTFTAFFVVFLSIPASLFASNKKHAHHERYARLDS